MDRDEELFYRLLDLTEEGRFNKHLQWNNLYYSLLLHSVVIALFQLPIQVEYKLYFLLNTAAQITISVITLYMIILQIIHSLSLNRNRKIYRIIQEELMKRKLEKQIYTKYEKHLKLKYKAAIWKPYRWFENKRNEHFDAFRNLETVFLYLLPFIFLLLCAFALTMIVLRLDGRQ